MKYKNPEGKFVVVTTGRSDSAGAWAEAHDLRRRGIALLVKAHGPDRTAEALGVHPDAARKHYLDAKQAFNSTNVFTQMAAALVPK